MMKLRYIPVAGAIAAAGLVVSTFATAQASTTANPFDQARAEWLAAGSAPTATLDSYLLQARDDLQKAGDPSYATAEWELGDLASLPVNGETPAQQAEWQKDVTALDKFFGTPNNFP